MGQTARMQLGLKLAQDFGIPKGAKNPPPTLLPPDIF